MAKPKALEIRGYNVGFGDCFLLTFDYGKTKKHVLIDFGTTQPPTGKTPSEYMLQVAEAIKKDCDGHLDAIVETHRRQGPDGAARVHRRGQRQESIGGEEPHRHGAGEESSLRLLWRRLRPGGRPPRRQGPRPRTADHRAVELRPQTAQRGQGRVLDAAQPLLEHAAAGGGGDDVGRLGRSDLPEGEDDS